MNQIKLADGRTYTVLLCGGDGGILVITMEGEMPILEAAQAFSDGKALAAVEYYEKEKLAATYTGYSQLFGVMNERFTHRTQIYLRREG